MQNDSNLNYFLLEGSSFQNSQYVDAINEPQQSNEINNNAQNYELKTNANVNKRGSKKRTKKRKQNGEPVNMGNSKRIKGTDEYLEDRKKNNKSLKKTRANSKQKDAQQKAELGQLLADDAVRLNHLKEKWLKLKTVIDTNYNGVCPSIILPHLETIQQMYNDITECRNKKLIEIEDYKKYLIADFNEACQAKLIEHNSLLANII